MVYTTPWETGLDTKKFLTKKMACWLDLVDIDQLIEDEAMNMNGMEWNSEPSNHGGHTDMTKPLPAVLETVLNDQVKKIQIQYDVLPDACYTFPQTRSLC
ncbi:hypothetical protein R1sor_010448 [Riccia sorocarpa]|uniref:Uncharacterized protein n=1 Tax=Riccia sorocarpa TaxID=122646 RepID=A0ABD3I1S5_9MARC